MTLRLLLSLCAAGVLGATAYSFKLEFKYEDYKDYLGQLAAISGMVFTIMGIWIALLYPNAMSRLTSSNKIIAADFSESQADSRRLEGIVSAVMASALVMMASLVANIAKIIFYATPFYSAHRLEIKSVALGFIALLTFIQLESVFRVVISNIMFINDIHFKRQSRKTDEDI